MGRFCLIILFYSSVFTPGQLLPNSMNASELNGHLLPNSMNRNGVNGHLLPNVNDECNAGHLLPNGVCICGNDVIGQFLPSNVFKAVICEYGLNGHLLPNMSDECSPM